MVRMRAPSSAPRRRHVPRTCLALATTAIIVLAACAPITRPVARPAPTPATTTTTPTATPTATPAPTPTPTAVPTDTPPGSWSQQGLASWYGPNFAGRPTANGEVFDPGRLTAAHKELPFDTRVRVTNVANGRSVVVRINDRGPFKPGRIIDLSRAGAEAIGLIASGVASVRVELADGPAGLRPLRTDARLGGYDVIAPGLPPGSLLVLRGPSGTEVLVRTVALEPPSDPGATGDDLWTSDVLAERLGTAATNSLD